MASLVWRGDAQARAQVDTLTPSNVEIGDIFTVTINRKDISVTATAATVANVVALLVAAIGQYNNAIEEFKEVSASSGTTDGEVTHVVVTGKTDGTPFTMTTSTTDAGNFDVEIETVTEGSAAVNEKQRVVLPGPPTGGTFTLTFDGQTTAATAYNASAATVVARLEALSNIAAGDVSVTLNGTGDWTVEFIQNFAGVDVPLMTGSGSSLTGGGSITTATTTQGAAGTNEVQTVAVLNSTTNWTINFRGQFMQSVVSPSASSAAQIQTALESLSTIGYGNIAVSKTDDGTTTTFTLTFVGALGLQDVDECTSSGGTVTTVTEGSSTGINEVQTVRINNAPTGGTFTLTYSGQTTAAIPYNETAVNLQAALVALSNIAAAPDDVSVARSGSGTLAAPYIYTITFQNLLGSKDVSQITANPASLTGGAVNVSTVQEAAAAVNEVETVTVSGASGGTFTLTFNAETTGAIAYNASAATVQAALEGLATPVPGDFSVAGADGGPWSVTFTGAYAATDVTEMTGDGTNLTGGGSQTLTQATTTTATGPNNVNDSENYSTGALPVNGDTLIVDDPNAGDMLWNLSALSAVTLAKLVVRQSFSKRIGLFDHNGSYYEYRAVEFTIGATSIEVGNGDGSGPTLVRLNTGSVATAIEVLNSGRSVDDSLKAVTWKGTHASNTAEILGGQFAAAIDQADLATLATLRVLASDIAGSSPDVFCGPGVTLGTVIVAGGNVALNSAIGTSLTTQAGQTVIRGAGAVAQLNGLGGRVVYNTSGTLGGNTVLAGDCILDFSQDMSTKTITNPIEIQAATAGVEDPNGVTSGLVEDHNYVDVQVNGRRKGRNRRLTYGVPA